MNPWLVARRVARSTGDYLRYHSAIGNTLSELVILVTAREWSQDFEWFVHYLIALKVGIAKDIADAIGDGRRPTGMSADEEIVYDFTIELKKNKRVSDATFNRAEQRFGKKGVVDMTRHQRLLHVPRDAIEHGALSVFWRRSPPIALSKLTTALASAKGVKRYSFGAHRKTASLQNRLNCSLP